MIGMLTQDYEVRVGKIKHYKLNYATSLIENLISVLDNYYKQSGFYVRRPNILVTLLESLEINIHDTESSAMFSAQEKYMRLANTLGFNTGIDFNSKPFRDTVFDNMDEFFIITEDKDTTCTCIYSTMDMLFLTHPKRYNVEFDADDFNTYAINIVNLVRDYHRWANRNMKEHPDTFSIDPAKFIYEEVITNLIPDIFRHSMFNRYNAIYEGKELSSFVNFNPFFVKDISKLVTSIQSWYIDEINKNKKIDYQELLSILPDLLNGNMLDTYKIPNVYTGVKGSWLLLLSRVSYFSFLLGIGDARMNHDLINELKIWLGLAKRKRYFDVPNLNVRYILNEKTKKLKDDI